MNGIDEGVAKGEARGSHHKSLEIAKKMMAKGMDEKYHHGNNGVNPRRNQKVDIIDMIKKFPHPAFSSRMGEFLYLLFLR